MREKGILAAQQSIIIGLMTFNKHITVILLRFQGSFLQHIHSTSGAVVTLRGRGSGYLDPNTTKESTEPMHIHLQ